MVAQKNLVSLTRRRMASVFGSLMAMFVLEGFSSSQDKADFPDGYDAVQAAPNSHKVVFENALVRVLEVSIPPSGTTEPMHHHRWPSFFLSWDTGGRTPHVRYLRPGAAARDQPSEDEPTHPGKWSIDWMKPEPMHAIQVVDNPESTPNALPLLRVEIKCG